MASDGDVMFNLIQNIEFIQGDGIDFIEGIQARDVLSVTLDDINYIVFGSIAFD